MWYHVKQSRETEKTGSAPATYIRLASMSSDCGSPGDLQNASGESSAKHATFHKGADVIGEDKLGNKI